MNAIPFGEVLQDRIQLSKRYSLIEFSYGIWKLTEKARKYYDPISYIKYLQGKIEKPIRIDSPVEIKPKTVAKCGPNEYKSPECQQLINEILSL